MSRRTLVQCVGLTAWFAAGAMIGYHYASVVLALLCGFGMVMTGPLLLGLFGESEAAEWVVALTGIGAPVFVLTTPPRFGAGGEVSGCVDTRFGACIAR